MTPPRVALQGVAGSYSSAAARALVPDAQHLPLPTFEEVFDALAAGEAAGAVVPVENSYAGPVADVFDLLREHDGVRVVAEALVRVRHCLLGPPGTTLAEVRVARSHPQALAQSRAFLRAHGIRAEAAYDTAGAAADVARSGDRTVAAIAARAAAERYGLAVLAEDIQTAPDNTTRFVAVAREEAALGVAAEHLRGATKASLVFATRNVPGALVRALAPFADGGVQLTRIESRPSRETPWDYVFYVDLEGDPARGPAAEAVARMREACAWVRILGTYPAAGDPIDP